MCSRILSSLVVIAGCSVLVAGCMDSSQDERSMDDTTNASLHTSALVEGFQGLGDFDNDGDSDILLRDANGVVTIMVIENGADVETVFIGDPSNDWTIEGVGDFDGDGDSDILWRHITGILAIWIMEDLQNVRDTRPPSMTADWSVLGIGDFNNDDVSDVLWRNADGTTVIWLMQDGNVMTVSGIPAPDTPEG